MSGIPPLATGVSIALAIGAAAALGDHRGTRAADIATEPSREHPYGPDPSAAFHSAVRMRNGGLAAVVGAGALGIIAVTGLAGTGAARTALASVAAIAGVAGTYSLATGISTIGRIHDRVDGDAAPPVFPPDPPTPEQTRSWQGRQIDHAFTTLDRNHDGQLAPGDVATDTPYGSVVYADFFHEALVKMDAGNDGQISKDEFTTWSEQNDPGIFGHLGGLVSDPGDPGGAPIQHYADQEFDAMEIGFGPHRLDRSLTRQFVIDATNRVAPPIWQQNLATIRAALHETDITRADVVTYLTGRDADGNGMVTSAEMPASWN